MNNPMYELHAEVCKTLSHPKRLEIISLLDHREMTAGAIVKAMGISKANVSQHLALLRNAGIVDTRRKGVQVHYRIASPKVVQACRLMREVLLETHAKREKLLRAARS